MASGQRIKVEGLVPCRPTRLPVKEEVQPGQSSDRVVVLVPKQIIHQPMVGEDRAALLERDSSDLDGFVLVEIDNVALGVRHLDRDLGPVRRPVHRTLAANRRSGREAYENPALPVLRHQHRLAGQLPASRHFKDKGAGRLARIGLDRHGRPHAITDGPAHHRLVAQRRRPFARPPRE